MKIANEILEAYLNCKTKGHLTLTGQLGSAPDYGKLLVASRKEVRRQAIGKILEHHLESEVATGILLTATALRAGPSIVLDDVGLPKHRFGVILQSGAPRECMWSLPSNTAASRCATSDLGMRPGSRSRSRPGQPPPRRTYVRRTRVRWKPAKRYQGDHQFVGSILRPEHREASLGCRGRQ